MSPNDLCEADKRLPDGNGNYDINNCGGDNGGFDVFRYAPGKFIFQDMEPENK